MFPLNCKFIPICTFSSYTGLAEDVFWMLPCCILRGKKGENFCGRILRSEPYLQESQESRDLKICFCLFWGHETCQNKNKTERLDLKNHLYWKGGLHHSWQAKNLTPQPKIMENYHPKLQNPFYRGPGVNEKLISLVYLSICKGVFQVSTSPVFLGPQTW